MLKEPDAEREARWNAAAERKQARNREREYEAEAEKYNRIPKFVRWLHKKPKRP